MAKCTSFDALLDGFREEAQMLPSAHASLQATTMWHLSYSMPDDTRKAMLARRGTDVGFSRLRAALAQPSLWTDRSKPLEVQLTPVK